MKLRSLITSIVGLLLMVAAAPALAALPTVNTFTMATSGFSPVPVLAFTATDTDGTVVGYIITTTITKPAASDSRWTATPWTSFSTTTTGTITLYAYAKDNANGVSAYKSFATTVVGGHNHDTVYVNEGQAGSVNSDMIVDATIENRDLKDGAVSAAKLGIVCMDGQYLRYTPAGGWACNAGTPGPQGPAGIQGPTGAQGPEGPAGSVPRYANVRVVAKSGGDYSDLLTAMSEIVQWCGTPSPTNPCLLKIMPGRYDLGSQVIALQPFVDIEGSGEGMTTIVGSAGPFLTMSSSELRSLAVEAVITEGFFGIEVNGGSAKFTDFTYTFGGHTGMYVNGAELAMRNATFLLGPDITGLMINNSVGDIDNMRIRCTSMGNVGIQASPSAANVVFRNGSIDGCGAGIYSMGMTIQNSSISCPGGVGISVPGSTIVNSRISGATALVTSPLTKVSFSEIDGQIEPLWGTGMSCFSVHDENFNAVTCP